MQAMHPKAKSLPSQAPQSFLMISRVFLRTVSLFLLIIISKFDYLV